MTQQYHSSRESIDRLLVSGNKHAIKLRIRTLEENLKCWRGFFNWPGLFESFEHDIERLRQALKQ